MTTAEMIVEIRENCSELGVEWLRDGYATEDTNRRKRVRILPKLNLCLKKLVWRGMKQCYIQKTLTAGTREYALPNSFTNIKFAHLVDPAVSTQLYPIYNTSLTRLNALYPGMVNSATTGRPYWFYLQSKILGFNVAVDQAYIFECLADVMPTELVLPTDEPEDLEELFHPVLVSGATYLILRDKLGTQEFNEGQKIRFYEHKSDWDEGVKMVGGTYEQRMLDSPDIAIKIEEYRMNMGNGGGRRGRST